MDVEKFFNEEKTLKIAFNAKRLRDILAGYKDSDVIIELNKEHDPAIVKEVGYSANRRFILPIRLKEEA